MTRIFCVFSPTTEMATTFLGCCPQQPKKVAFQALPLFSARAAAFKEVPPAGV